MKHIKIYEKFNTKIKIGNFVIWKDEYETYYEILEITKINRTTQGNKYWSKTIYIHRNNQLILKNSRSEQFFYDEDSMSVKFISKNIEDCLKYMDILSDSNKFNL